MRERIDQFLRGIMAGIMICIGAVILLSCESKVLGAFLFAIGLLTILVFKLNLFTGKVGYILDNKPSYLIEVGITWLGNIVGTFIAAYVIKFTRIYAGFDRLDGMVETKLNDSMLSIFILSIFCGILMFIAVDTFNKRQDTITGVIAVFVCVMTFILAGFEHCVANMAYFSLAGAWSLHALWYMIIMSVGNLVGGLVIPVLTKLRKE